MMPVRVPRLAVQVGDCLVNEVHAQFQPGVSAPIRSIAHGVSDTMVWTADGIGWLLEEADSPFLVAR